MTLQMENVDTITFDSFTTLVDALEAMERGVEPYTDDPTPIVERWRSRAVAYRMLCNFMDWYGTYMETTRAALEYSLETHGIQLDVAEIEDIASTFYELRIFDDVANCMEQLDEAGYDLYIASNGTPDLLDSIVSRAGVEAYVQGVISADEIRTYKPDVEFYEHVSNRTGTALDRTIHVATPWYDTIGAVNAGMQSVWVNRREGPWEAFGPEPDATVSGLKELTDAIITAR